MRIVADENIPLLDEFFGCFGEIRRLPGRAIDRAALEAAEVLLVRSVTPVTRELLEGSAVRFVGTCTIGTDHLDLAYFAEAGIAWASAPGCNARGVVDYVLGSLVALAEHTGADLSRRCYGIVGAGQVGGRLAEVLRRLGWQVRVCDPPLQAREGGDLLALEQVIEQCDVLSLHTPLTASGTWATHHLFDAHRLGRLRQGAWLINASRGAVVDNAALGELLARRDDLQVVLDVWEGEPSVDAALVARCRIATAHIAGYSLDGKLRGTAQAYQALCRYLRVEPEVRLERLTPVPWLAEVTLQGDVPLAWALGTLCRAVYDPRRDDADLRRALVGDEAARRAAFDVLRKTYPVRREIEGQRVRLIDAGPDLKPWVEALGAIVVT